MHRLLADESLYIKPQLVVLDQRQGLLEYVDEELFTRRQQQVQDIAVKAIEGASGSKALSHVNQIAMEQAKNRPQG